MSSLLPTLGFVYLLAVVVVMTVVVPYTKVEESFNMQAIHDLVHLDLRPHLDWSLCSQRVHHTAACSQRDLPNRTKCAVGSIILELTTQLIGATRTAPRLLTIDSLDTDLSVENNRDFVSCGEGIDGTLFDHVQFPGVVPRTFAGAAGLAGLLWAIMLALEGLGLAATVLAADQGLALQLGARLLLALAVVLSCRAMARAAPMSPPARALNYIMVASCYHLCFYASRTLPNTFALVGVNVALALLMGNRGKTAFALLAAIAAVFRSDVLVLIFPLALVWVFVLGRVSLLGGAASGVAGALLAVIMTVPLDSILWGRPLWPEAEVLLFNTVDNRSGEWGVSPAHWYFTSAIPKAFLGYSLLALVAPIIGCFRSMRSKVTDTPALIGACVLVFVGLYSVLPHKEVRFVLIGFPALLLCAAQLGIALVGAPRFLLYRKATEGGRWLVWISAVLVVLMGVVPFALLGGLQVFAASANYPGADALRYVNRLSLETPDAKSATHVFIDAYGGMTGVTRFLKHHHSPSHHALQRIIYNKDPSLFDFTDGVGAVKGCDKGFDYLVVRAEWAALMEEACDGRYALVRNVTTVDTVNYKRLQFTSQPFLAVFAVGRGGSGVLKK